MTASENFVIAGVHHSGPSKGKAIEAKPLDKVVTAVGMAAANYDHDFSVWVKDVVLGPVSFTKRGDLLASKYEHNDYVAEGTGLFTYLRKTSSTLLEPTRRSFKIKFHDCLNRYGAPDLKIDFFESEPAS